MPPPMTGGHVTGPVLIWRSDRLVVAVRHVVAFPAGVVTRTSISCGEWPGG